MPNDDANPHRVLCHICQKDFKDEKCLAHHTMDVHDATIPKQRVTSGILCHFCDKAFNNEEIHATHTRSVHAATIHVHTVHASNNHGNVNQTTQKILFKCVKCPNSKEFATPEALKQHQINRAAWHNCCLKCNKLFWTRAGMLAHKDAVHGSIAGPLESTTAFNSQANDQVGVPSASLQKMATAPNLVIDGGRYSKIPGPVEGNEGEDLIVLSEWCVRCKKTFADVDALHTHLMSSPAHNYCVICSVDLSSHELFEYHFAYRHGKSSEHCDNKSGLAGKEALKAQLSSNSGRHYCTVCDKGFFSAKLLHEHAVKFHNKDEAWCSKCKATFANHAALTGHMMSSLNHHYCPICKVEFETRGKLDVHDTAAHSKLKENFRPASAKPQKQQEHTASYGKSENRKEEHSRPSNDKSRFNMTKMHHKCLECEECFESSAKMWDHYHKAHYFGDFGESSLIHQENVHAEPEAESEAFAKWVRVQAGSQLQSLPFRRRA